MKGKNHILIAIGTHFAGDITLTATSVETSFILVTIGLTFVNIL